MTRNTLKYIAIIAMTLDHIAAFTNFISPVCYFIFKFIGRITFPIMCFFIAQGFKYTSNKKRYALRLLSFALISQIPWILLYENTLLTFNIFFKLNTIFTLLFSYLFIWNLNSNNKKSLKVVLSISLILLSLLCDYKFIGIIYILYFYYLENKNQKLYLPLLLLTCATLNILLTLTTTSNAFSLLSNTIIYLGLFLTIPLLYFYNNKTSIKSKFNKYLFYFYYPLHLLGIFFINILI
jgi:hypothetical protein